MPTTETLIKSSEKYYAKDFTTWLCGSSSFPMECAALSQGNSTYECKALAVLEADPIFRQHDFILFH